jgi:uncharacterized protein (DUF1697 family)
MAGGPREDSIHVALLRGVNVGGKHRLPMKDLVAMFEAAGCRDVQTCIQSGNVVFRTTRARATRVPGRVAKAVADRLGFEAPVLVRTAAEFRAVALGNPFLRAGADPGTLHVLFLADRPPPGKVATLDPSGSPPDEFVVLGREIYLRCPGGVARTRLTTGWADSILGTISTMRHWRTVLKLVEMAEEA